MTEKEPSCETPGRHFRLSDATIADLDLISRWLSAEMGRDVNRSDAVRYAARELAKKIRKKSPELC